MQGEGVRLKSDTTRGRTSLSCVRSDGAAVAAANADAFRDLPPPQAGDPQRRNPLLRIPTLRDRCREEDSNLRRLSQRVYSPPPLATREPLQGRRIVAGRGPAPTLGACRRTTRSSSGPGRPGRRRRSTSPAPARGVLLVDKARFPRDKPCGGGLTGRALKRIPVDPSPVVERDVDRFELRLRYGSSFAREPRRAADPDDAAPPARRLPRRAGGRGRRRAPRRRRGSRRSSSTTPASPRGSAATRCAPACSSAPTARTASSRGRSASTTAIVRGVALEGNVPLEALRRRPRADGGDRARRRSPAATAGSSRRATTRTSASAAGGARGRGCATTSRGSPARTASTRTR